MKSANQGVGPAMAPSGDNGHSSVVPEDLGDRPDLSRPAGTEKTSVDTAWLLWRNRRFLAQVTAAGLLAFTALAFVLPKHYTATVRLMPPDYTSSISTGLAVSALSGDSGAGSNGGGALMGLANHLLGFNSSGELIVGVLKSDTLEDGIIEKFNLMKEFGTRYPEDARKRLESDTDIQSDMKTGIISIAIENRDPKKAAEMAQEEADALNELLAQVNTSAAHRERVFIEERLKTIKQELDAATSEFSVFASQNTAINIPDQIKAMVGAAADLQGQLMAAESQLRAMQQVYTDSNVNVREMKAIVDELHSQLNKLGGKDVTPASGGNLSKDELYPSIRQLPLLGVKYLDLFRRTKIDEAAFELLSKEYEAAKVEEAREVPTVAILDLPAVPQKKSSPHRLRIMILGMLFSLAGGVATVIGKSNWQQAETDNPKKVLAEEILRSLRLVRHSSDGLNHQPPISGEISLALEEERDSQ